MARQRKAPPGEGGAWCDLAGAHPDHTLTGFRAQLLAARYGLPIATAGTIATLALGVR